MFTIGWTGGFRWGHQASLEELVFPAIKALPFPCRLLLVGVQRPQDQQHIRSYFADAPLVKVEIVQAIDWNAEPKLQSYFLQMDVGIATLSNTEYHLSKSGIKVKQYLNNGIPVLTNQLPENDWLIREGQNGYFCNNWERFRDRLAEFWQMSDGEYQRFARASRAGVPAFDHAQFWQVILASLEE